MSSNRTWEQATHLLKFVTDKAVSPDQLQRLFNSGLLADLFDTPNVDNVSRYEFRRLLGLLPVVKGNTKTSFVRDEGFRLVIPQRVFNWDNYRHDVQFGAAFLNLIQRAKNKPVKERVITVGRSILIQNASDPVNRDALPIDHLLQLHEFVHPAMNGGVEKDGCWHLAYVGIATEVYVVCSRWCSDSKQWSFVRWDPKLGFEGWAFGIRSGYLDPKQWDAGGRILFRDSRVV